MAPIRRLALLAAAAAVGLAFGPAAEAAVQTLVFKSGPVTVTPYDAITRTARSIPAGGGRVRHGDQGRPRRRERKRRPEHAGDAPSRRLRQDRAPDYTCPGTYAQRFFAEGEEHYAMSLPNGYGYPNKASTTGGCWRC